MSTRHSVNIICHLYCTFSVPHTLVCRCIFLLFGFYMYWSHSCNTIIWRVAEKIDNSCDLEELLLRLKMLLFCTVWTSSCSDFPLVIITHVYMKSWKVFDKFSVCVHFCMHEYILMFLIETVFHVKCTLMRNVEYVRKVWTENKHQV